MTLATGGTTYDFTADGVGYRVHVFTAGGDLVVSQGGELEYLIVAGGGGGGRRQSTNQYGGGGGGGGLLAGSTTVTAQIYPVTVGAGAAEKLDGGNSTALGLTAYGGGSGGVSDTLDGNAGGSGGGGAGGTTAGAGGSGSPGQGYDGGKGYRSTSGTRNGGGGGGAGGAGVGGGASGSGGTGGLGVSSSITGTPVTYSQGGYAQGALAPYTPGPAGSGGGGGNNLSIYGATGRDGIVIVRYLLASSIVPLLRRHHAALKD